MALFVERARAVSPELRADRRQRRRRGRDLPPPGRAAAGHRAGRRPGQGPLAGGAAGAADEPALGPDGGAGDRPARQRTMRAAIAWSHDLLDARSRRSSAAWPSSPAASRSRRRRRSWRRRAIPASISSTGSPRWSTRACCGGSTAPGDEPRFAMLETVREFGLERLARERRGGSHGGRPRAVFLALAEQAEPELLGPRSAAWLDRLEAEHDNLRAALAWALERDDGEAALRLAGALGRFWRTRGYLGEGAAWLERALAAGAAAAATLARQGPDRGRDAGPRAGRYRERVADAGRGRGPGAGQRGRPPHRRRADRTRERRRTSPRATSARQRRSGTRPSRCTAASATDLASTAASTTR